MKDITLALGGGGLKGNAYIGVLRVLEREGFNVRAIAGTSAGGLWGALYAFGFSPDEIQRRMGRLDTTTLFTRQLGEGPGWLGLGGVRKLLQNALGDSRIEDLRIPFAATSVDLETAEHIVLCEGKVVDAVLSTIAIPGIFPPQNMDGRTLIDGGLVNPVPINVARSLAPRYPVVAVVLLPPMDDWEGVEKPRVLNSIPFLSEALSRLRFAQAFNIFTRAIDIGSAVLTELILQLEKPDVIIRPAVSHMSLLERADVSQVALLGEQATERALPELRRVTGWPAYIGRRLNARQTQPFRLPYSSDFTDVDGSEEAVPELPPKTDEVS